MPIEHKCEVSSIFPSPSDSPSLPFSFPPLSVRRTYPHFLLRLLLPKRQRAAAGLELLYLRLLLQLQGSGEGPQVEGVERGGEWG